MIQLLLDKLARNEALNDFVVASVSKELAANSLNDDLLVTEAQLLSALLPIETYINSDDTRGALLSMTALAWIIEHFDQISVHIMISVEIPVQCSLKASLRWLTEHNYDCLVMSLFIWSICSVQSFNKVTGDLVVCAILENVLFSDKSILNDTTASLSEKQKCKIQYWSYRALINIAKQHGAFILCTAQLFSVLLERAHSSVWGALGDPTERGLVVHPCAAADEVEASVQDRCRLYSVQLELLSLLPLFNELTPLYTATQHGLQNVTVTISDALKRSKSAEETILACCQLWQVTVRICAGLLLSVPTSTTTSLKQALGTVTERKEQFMDFLAPKSGVGVLAAPLQLILKRSRWHAALCYHSLAQSLTTADNQTWFEPANVLKLLLRCLYHILCVTSTAPSRTTTPISKRNREGDAVAGYALAEPCCLEWENRNMQAIAVAAEALALLCTHISAKQLSVVPYISVSLGRTTTTATTAGATAVTERSSIDILTHRLLHWRTDTTTTALNALTTLPLHTQLQTVLKVCAGIQCFSILCANLCRTEQDSANNIVHTQQNCNSNSKSSGAEGETDVTSTGYYLSGLFTSSIENHSIRDELASDRVNISTTRVFEYVNKIISVGRELVEVYILYCNIQQNTEKTVFDRLLQGCAPECDKKLSSLVCAWQACVLRLAQSLFQELSLLGDDNLCGTDQKNDTTTATTTTTAAVTSVVQSSSQHQHQQCGNVVYRHSPHLFAFSSQLSQQMCIKQRQHQLSQRQSIVHSNEIPTSSLPLEGDHVSQLVMCSAHPPVVQATVDLLYAAVQMWRHVWLGSELGRRQHHSRVMFVEALWWFLLRTSSFSVEMTERELAPLREQLQQLQPWLCAEHCPQNAAGLVMLLTFSHAGLCNQHSSTASMHSSDCVFTLQRAQHRCLNGLTEAGVLPGLFAWIPKVLVGGAQSSPQPRQGRDKPNVILCLSSTTATAVADKDSEGEYPAVTLLLSHFLALSLQQLSSMTVPSPSEQQSPALMHTMIAGLGDLVVAPLVIAVRGRSGLGVLLLDPSEASLTTSTVQRSLPPTDSPVLYNWKKILQLWLELRISAGHLGFEEDSVVVADGMGHAGGEDWRWVGVLLQPHTPSPQCIPVQWVAWQGEKPNDVLQERMRDMFAALLFAQTALDTSIQHCRSFPQSNHTTNLCTTACAIVVNCVCSLETVGVGVLLSDVLRSADAVLNKILSLLPALHAHLSSLSVGSIHCQYPAASVKPSQSWVFSVLCSVFMTIATLTEGEMKVDDAVCNALQQKFISQWTLAAVSALCTIHTNTLHGSKQAGFRPANATLALTAEYCSVLKAFISAFTPMKLNEELWDFLQNAWVELGGKVEEIGKIRNSQSHSIVTTAAMSKPETFNSPPPAATVAMTGQKRSFAVLSANKATPNQPPVPSHTDITAKKSIVLEHNEPSNVYLKVSVPSQELQALVAKTSGGARVRQGLVPATYTAADRANLDQQSQALSQALCSQQPSQRLHACDPTAGSQQRASITAPGPLQQHVDALSTAVQTATSVHAEQSTNLQHMQTSALPEQQQQQEQHPQHEQQHSEYHSESTTYVSPSPALSAGAARRVQTGYFHSRYSSTAITAAAEAEPAVSLTQDMQKEATSPNIATTSTTAGVVATAVVAATTTAANVSTSTTAVVAATTATTTTVPAIIAASATTADVSTTTATTTTVTTTVAVASDSGEQQPHSEERRISHTAAAVPCRLAAALQNTQTSLQDCIRRVATTLPGDLPEPPHLHTGISSSNSSSNNSTGMTAECERLLATTIQQSHELTGLLLSLWNRQHKSRE